MKIATVADAGPYVSRLLAFEARRLLEWLGCEVRMFDPKGCR